MFFSKFPPQLALSYIFAMTSWSAPRLSAQACLTAELACVFWVWLICIFFQTLQQLKDKSKRESFKPFDRSFLIKRQTTGEDIFRGASKKYKAPLSDKDEEIQKLWRENGDLSGNTSFVISN